MILYMYIAPEQGLTTPWGRNGDEHLVTSDICCKFQKISLKSDFIPFFHILYMYIAACQGQSTIGDKILMSTETSCHLLICVKFQKILLEV